MHQLYKFKWAIRAIIYRLFFGSFEFPGYIGKPTFLLAPRRIHISKRVRIFPGIRAECHGNGRLFVHKNVSIGQNFHIICNSDLHIGSGCLISANVFITDTDHSYVDITLPVFDQPDLIRPTKIGENCFIGIGARIQAGTQLGKGCVVGANAVVRGEFPDHSLIVGIPGRCIKRYNFKTKEWERC